MAKTKAESVNVREPVLGDIVLVRWISSVLVGYSDGADPGEYPAVVNKVHNRPDVIGVVVFNSALTQAREIWHEASSHVPTGRRLVWRWACRSLPMMRAVAAAELEPPPSDMTEIAPTADVSLSCMARCSISARTC